MACHHDCFTNCSNPAHQSSVLEAISMQMSALSAKSLFVSLACGLDDLEFKSVVIF